MDTLLITVAIGEKYQKRYKALFYENHKSYAIKCGYDFKIVMDFLDKNNQHASFISLQKSLVCSQDFSQKYKKIIYVDADILFNIKTATPIHLLTENENIYIVDEYSQPTQD